MYEECFLPKAAAAALQVKELIQELDAAGCEALGLMPDPGTVPRLLAYARSVASFPTAVKEVRSPCPHGPARSLSTRQSRVQT